MRYLKTYKLFENITDDFLLDIEDIILEIKDQDLFIRKSMNSKDDKILIRITKTDDIPLKSKFEINQDISNSLWRLSNYVKRLGWSFCTFEVHLSRDEWYQMSGSDIEDYIGKEVWFIDVNVSDYRGPEWYKMRYGTNESKQDNYIRYREVRDDIKFYLSDLEDYGYVYSVSSDTSGDWYNIYIDISKKNADTIDIGIVKEKINQISDLAKPFIQKEVIIIPKYLRRVSMPKSLKYENINDFTITELLTGDGKKHTYLRDGEFKEIIEEIEFHVMDWGMEEWMDELKYSVQNEQKNISDWTKKDIKFISTKQFDDFEVDVPISDLESDVRMCISDMRIEFIYKPKE